MTFQSRELYRSGPNGDRWSLVREPASGRVFIEHEPNISSGGQPSRMEIGDFLAHGGHGPEVGSRPILGTVRLLELTRSSLRRRPHACTRRLPIEACRALRGAVVAPSCAR